MQNKLRTRAPRKIERTKWNRHRRRPRPSEYRLTCGEGERYAWRRGWGSGRYSNGYRRGFGLHTTSSKWPASSSVVFVPSDRKHYYRSMQAWMLLYLGLSWKEKGASTNEDPPPLPQQRSLYSNRIYANPFFGLRTYTY